MAKLSTQLQHITDAIAQASKVSEVQTFLRGEFAQSLIKDLQPDNLVEISLVGQLDRDKFYNNLRQSITINKEIESTGDVYFIVTDNYLLRFDIYDKLPPQKTSTDIRYDLVNNKFVDDLSNIQHSPSIVKRINQEDWNLSHVLHLAEDYGNIPDSVVDEEVGHLLLYDLKEPLDESVQQLIVNLILTAYPGHAFEFLSGFADGKKWISNRLIDLATHLNIKIDEDMTIEGIIGDKKQTLLNIYGEFFRSQLKSNEETHRETRLNTNLRLIFDSPSITLELPYIQEQKLVTASQLPTEEAKKDIFDKSTFIFPQVPQNPYEEPACVPADCDPPCCCCDPISTISEVAIRCHDKVVISCDDDGDAPGPGLDPFPADCDLCRETCSDLLGPNSQVECANLRNQPWWQFGNGLICECTCGLWRGQPGASTCDLTCVFCGLLCHSVFEITSGTNSCTFQANLRPSDACCGSPGIAEIMFVIDFSGSMGSHIANVRSQISALTRKASESGATVRFGLVSFGRKRRFPEIEIPFTDVNDFTSRLATVPTDGSTEWDIFSTDFAARHASWTSNSRYIILIGDEPTQLTGDQTAGSVAALLNQLNIVCYVIDNPSPDRALLATATGGERFQIGKPFFTIADQLDIIALPASCDCLDPDPVPVTRSAPECLDLSTGEILEEAPESCFNIPIQKCLLNQDCSTVCDIPFILFSCGHTIEINPITIQTVCCSEVSFGCDCREDPQPPQQCCGPEPECDPVCDPVTNSAKFVTVELAKQFVWCQCFDKSVTRDPQECTDCCCPDEEREPGHIWYPCYRLREILENDPTRSDIRELLNAEPPICCDVAEDAANACCTLCVWLDDGLGGLNRFCKDEIDLRVEQAYADCRKGGAAPPEIPEFECPQEDCDQVDECISSQDTDDPCSVTDGQGSVRHPTTVVLNNGVGLVAYEVRDGDVPHSNIRLEQFKTSNPAKILPHRIFNYGRLQNSTKWSSNPLINGNVTGKLYYFEDIPDHLISGLLTTEDGSDCSPFERAYFNDFDTLSFPENITGPGARWDSVETLIISTPSPNTMLGLFDDSDTVKLSIDSLDTHTQIKLTYIVWSQDDTLITSPEISVSSGVVTKLERTQIEVNTNHPTNAKTEVVAHINHSFSSAEFTFSGGTNSQAWGLDEVEVMLCNGETPSLIDPDDWDDSLTFVSGPLVNQCFPLALDPVKNSAIGSDSVGKFILFYVPENLNPSSAFPSADDIYNIQWFISNKQDTGLIGDAIDGLTDGDPFLFSGSAVVTQKLRIIEHLHDGSPVPVAFPRLAVARNYQNASENSHYVFLSYQAMENGKWNIYLRQFRLSEYDKNLQIIGANPNRLSSLLDLDIEEVLYKIVCVQDSCTPIATDFALKRRIVMEVILPDGREVLNRQFSVADGDWGSLCLGEPAASFPKRKVFVRFNHVVIADRCADQFTMDEIFCKWEVGEEYFIHLGPLVAETLFTMLKREDDSSVDLGSDVVTVNDTTITSSVVSAAWFSDLIIEDGGWYVMTDDPLEVLEEFKGFDISEPILLTPSATQHAMHPVVAVNFNNDVFVAFESVENDLTQVKVIGTAIPSTALPTGILNHKKLDDTLNLFLKPSDFTYSHDITTSTNRLNQLPDIYIDLNDVVHVTWQSNRNQDWEIYYAKSADTFINHRITKAKGKSLKPRIDGDHFGTMLITWHDNRFSNWEIMLAYQASQRLVPFSQQDPYWAGQRNNYVHYQDTVPLVLKNNNPITGAPLCINNIRVSFHVGRLKEKTAFTIRQDRSPFAFRVTQGADITNVVNTQSFTSFVNWVETVISTEDPYDPYSLTNTVILTGPEYDSEIVSSIILRIQLLYSQPDDDTPIIEIAFRASNESNNPLSSQQWTLWADISSFNGEFVDYSDLSLVEVRGRYKQVRLRLTYADLQPAIESFIIESVSEFRLCINPQEEAIVELDLTPEIRVDQEGMTTTEVPLPELFIQNNTYFISILGELDDGSLVSFDDPESTVSCFRCIRSIENWEKVSCTISLSVSNDTDQATGFDFVITFYSNEDLDKELAKFTASDGSDDLEFFTLANGDPVADLWTSEGLVISPSTSANLLLYPKLSDAGDGLICGITYFVTIDQTRDGITDRLETKRWICDCNAPRWAGRFDPIQTQINKLDRWASSGFGFVDTRLTDSYTNNFNPVIRTKNNFNGIVIYESNRTDPNIYELYGSVFKFLPDFDMYASGGQSIISPSNQIHARTDIPLGFQGQNASFQTDFYDNLFLAYEKPFDQSQCNVFEKERLIVVHRCGLDGLDFDFEFDHLESVSPEEPLPPEKCIPRITCEISPEDPILEQIVKQVRVKSDFVQYHITRRNNVVPVVGQCETVFIVVGTPEIVALRIRNSTDQNWSEWMPFDPEVGEYTMEVPWRLSQFSGSKTVSFQFATYNGLAATVNFDIIADYERLPFILNLYKPVPGKIKPPTPVTDNELTDVEIFNQDNRLNLFDNAFPVAAIRPPVITDSSVFTEDRDYIFVEIIPGRVQSLADSIDTVGKLLDILFIIDGSPSMSTVDPSGTQSRQEWARRGVLKIVDDLLSSTCKPIFGVHIGSQSNQINGGFTDPTLSHSETRAAVEEALESFSGDQNLYDYFDGSFDSLPWREGAKKIVFFINDTHEDRLGNRVAALSHIQAHTIAVIVVGLPSLKQEFTDSILGQAYPGVFLSLNEDIDNDFIPEWNVNLCTSEIIDATMPGLITEATDVDDGDEMEISELIFDFIQQGSNSQFNVPTTKIISRDGITTFRGVITIHREELPENKDGMSFIIPRFPDDCTIKIPHTEESPSSASLGTGPASLGKFNILASDVVDEPLESKTAEDIQRPQTSDPWESERDEFGRVRHRIVIRPDEDPYFVFGDPNYRLKLNEQDSI